MIRLTVSLSSGVRKIQSLYFGLYSNAIIFDNFYGQWLPMLENKHGSFKVYPIPDSLVGFKCQSFKGVLAIRRIFSLVDMIAKPKF